MYTGELEITSFNGPEMENFSFYSGDEAISINGLPFIAGQAITGIAEGPSFTFEIPYDVVTDIPFIILQTSHPPAVKSAPIPILSQSGMIMFFIFLVGSAEWVIRRRKRQESM